MRIALGTKQLNGCMQLLGADDEQAMVTNSRIQGMIQEYGQSLTSSDPHLALEYYWQAAAVVGGSISVKVRQLSTALAVRTQMLHCLYCAIYAGSGPPHTAAMLCAAQLCLLCISGEAPWMSWFFHLHCKA